MKYKSEIYEVVHQDATEMFKIGAISKERMREFDKMCLAPETDAAETSSSQKTEVKHAELVTA
jgi:DNA-binding transcriptional regulator YiaG